MKRTDERDVIFSRMAYKPGSPAYTDYYARHPEREQADRELREKPAMCSPGTPTYDPALAPAVEANFELLAHMRPFCDGISCAEKASVDASEISERIKRLAVHYGAADAGVTEAKAEFYYSHRGRHAENYGEPVDTGLKRAIVFTVRMDDKMINTAPAMPSCLETSKAYVEAAVIGLQIAAYIRNLGYHARCHMDGSYLMKMVPLAESAGLGERGRSGLLISGTNGPFVRIGAVATNMPLTCDKRDTLDVARFCRLCGLCIKTCPGKTVSVSDEREDWYISQEACYTVWRNLGTDCGICISACPVGQELPAEKIKTMTDDDMRAFVKRYTEKHGSRKRARTSAV